MNEKLVVSLLDINGKDYFTIKSSFQNEDEISDLSSISNYCHTYDLKLLINVILSHGAGIMIIPELTECGLRGLGFMFLNKDHAANCINELDSIALSNKLIDNKDQFEYSKLSIFDIGLILEPKNLHY